uniref:Uncharacterized protein n=1 Tax=Mucochytrium quahogii TaxID=96639 RepID=A0A7S2WKN9_9STRA|mmetsp:Transcript_36660/g.59130  ORF Transcript_36660/g.59130 Transcript_36660/m.59130 type:complete len:3541 (-) Transcript_36660:1507-12129(-)|eukprot:CAMPEP_0203760268 /NCGR_PEP_ID=MMETSP0098-20131031/13602_1 /ASSEMBLY_ACC=CAM_ASM_000208 /TAXON_ID=96639 /ORGANISM=" , Strain NY0313808BC1" /LENGTH=3540 /DNA_ID=CAMNT_0050653765 /DNA_START=178 /DNA_END=10800 /DNA_ORIENTATION=+
MAKRILLGVLQDYFGRYIEGLNEENLRLAVWAGEIDLEGLELKKEVLDSLRLPLQIECGHIHKFSVSVPWTKLGSEPVRVNIDGVYLLAKLSAEDPQMHSGANNDDNDSEEDRSKLPRRIVEKRIRLRWANLLAAKDSADENGENKDTFWSRMAAKIMDNLQINVTNVHLRIEDYMSIPGKCFSFGVTFEKFFAVTCDENGQRVFVERNKKNDENDSRDIHKSVRLQSLAVYFDDGKPMLSNEGSTTHRSEGDFVYLLAKGIWREEMKGQHTLSPTNPMSEFGNMHNFLLLPCSPSMLVAKNESSDFTKPRYRLDVDFDSVDVTLSQDQYHILMTLKRSLAQHSILSVYREHRPPDSPEEDPRAWWRYAYTCVKINNAAIRLSMDANVTGDNNNIGQEKLLELTRKKNDWLEIVSQVRMREEYITLYKEKMLLTEELQVENGLEISREVRDRIQKLEDDLEVECTLAYRATAIAELTAEQKKAEGAKKNDENNKGGALSGTRRWITGWFQDQPIAEDGENSDFEDSDDDEDDDEKVPSSTSLSVEEKNELLDAVNFFETIRDQAIPDGTIHAIVVSSLRHGSVSLLGDSNDVLFACSLSGTHSLEKRFGGAWKHEFILKTLLLEDLYSDADDGWTVSGRRGTVLAPKCDSNDDAGAFIVNVSYSPPVYADGGKSDILVTSESFKVRVVTIPFQIVLLPHWVNGISSFFLLKDDSLETGFDKMQQRRVSPSHRRARTSSSSAPFRRQGEEVDFSEEGNPVSYDDVTNVDVNWVSDYISKTQDISKKLEEERKTEMIATRKPMFDVQLSVAAPILLLPLLGFTSRKGDTKSLLILDLGHFFADRNDLVKLGGVSPPVDAEDNEQQEWHQQGKEEDDDFFHAVESELQDNRLKRKTSVEADSGTSVLHNQVLTFNEEWGTMENDSNDAYGTWKITAERIRSVILTVRNGKTWEAMYNEVQNKDNGEDTFRLIDDFDISVKFHHVMSKRKNQRVDVVLGKISIAVVPSKFLILWKLRQQWLKQEWWWLDVQEQGNRPSHERISSISSLGTPNSPVKQNRKRLSSVKSLGTVDSTAEREALPEARRKEAKGTTLCTHYTFRMNLIEIHVRSEKSSRREEQNYLLGSIKGFHAEYIQRFSGSYAHLELGSFDVVDLYANSDATMYFVRSGDADDGLNLHQQRLITIDVRWRGQQKASNDRPQTPPISPRNALAGNGSFTQIVYAVVRFHKLVLTWNPITVAALRQLYVHKFGFLHITAVPPSPVRAKIVHHVSESSGKSLEHTGTSNVQYVVMFSLASVSVRLRKRTSILSEIDVKKASVKLSQSRESISLNGELGNVRLSGRNRELFSVVSDQHSLVVFSFFSRQKVVELDVKFSASRYTHLNQTYLELHDYISTGVVETIFGNKNKKALSEGAGGVLKNAIKTTGDRERAGGRFEIVMECFQCVLPASMHPEEKGFLAASCTDLRASNCTEKVQPGGPKKTNIVLGGLQMYTDVAPLLQDPVRFDMSVSKDDERGLIVLGKISDVHIDLAQEQYWLIQTVFRENILIDPIIEPDAIQAPIGEPPSPMEDIDENVTDEILPVEGNLEYGYDDLTDGPGLVYKVDITLEQASLLLSEGAQATKSTALASFSMQSFFAHIYRDGPFACTAVELQVKSLDLLDRREANESNWYRHLILSNPRLTPQSSQSHDKKDQAFIFRFVPTDRIVELELISFRSVFMLDLLGSVIGFWVSSPDDKDLSDIKDSAKVQNTFEDEDPNGSEIETNEVTGVSSGVDESSRTTRSHSNEVPEIDPNENLTDWTGNFKLIDPCLCFVPDYSDPLCKMILVRTDITFTWNKCGNPTAKQFSYWNGCLNSMQAYVATGGKLEPSMDDGVLSTPGKECNIFGREDDSVAQFAFRQEKVLHQLLEPTDVNFSFDTEEVSRDSRIQSRRTQLMFNQLELYASMGDFELIGKIAANLKGADAEEVPVEAIRQAKTKQRLEEMFEAIKNQDSTRTLEMDSDTDEDNINKKKSQECLVDVRIDQDYVEFIVPESIRNIGIILEQDHGFLRVESMYKVGGGWRSICEECGVKPGDYLVELNGNFVCNEAPTLVHDRIISMDQAYTLKFLRATSDKPVVLQNSLNAGTSKVIFNFIDDLDDGDLPIANIVLNKIDCFMNGSNDGNTIYGAQVEMTGAHFYDLRAGSWGVLLDPGEINVSCTRYNSGEFEINCDVPDPLSCNLSNTFIHMLKNTVGGNKSEQSTSPTQTLEHDLDLLSAAESGRLLDQGRASDVNIDPEKNCAFLLRNETGLPLKFWKEGDDESSAIDVSDEPKDVPFSFRHHYGNGKGIVRGFCQYKPLAIAFYMQSSSKGTTDQVWETLEGVVVNKIGGGVARLSSKKSCRSISPNGLKIKWSVEIDDTSRKIKVVLSSLLAITNHLDYGVRVLASCPTWMGSRSLPWPIKPKETRYLPALFGDAIEIRVQPMLPEHLEESASHLYEWSGPIYTSLASGGGTSTSTELECSLANGKTRFLCASVEPGEDRVTTLFSFYPQLRVRNLLPQDIIYQEHIPALSVDLPIGGGSIVAGEEKQLHSLSSNSRNIAGMTSHLVMKLEDSTWTELIPLRLPPNLSKSRSRQSFRNISFLSGKVHRKPVQRGNSKKSRKGSRRSRFKSYESANTDNDEWSSDSEASDEFSFDESDVEEVEDNAGPGGDQRDAPSGGGSERPGAIRVAFKDASGTQCTVCVVCEETDASGLLVIIYAEYWILNHTSLPLRFGTDDGRHWVFPTALNKAKEDSSLMMYNPGDDKRLLIGFERAQATTTVGIETPGMSGHVHVPCSPDGSLALNLGVAVDVGPGVLHRTNIITIVPRYTFTNLTSCDLHVRQFVSGKTLGPESIVSVGRSLPMWSSPGMGEVMEPYFQIRFGLRRVTRSASNEQTTGATEWSQPFEVLEILRKRSVLTCRLKRGFHYEYFQLEAQVGDCAGSVVVELSERGLDLKKNDAELSDEKSSVSGGNEGETSFKVKQVRMDLSVRMIQITFLKDQTDLVVFYRGTEKARTARAVRIEDIKRQRRVSARGPIEVRAPVHIHNKRPLRVLSVALEKFACELLSGKLHNKAKINCGNFRVLDLGSRPLFPTILSRTTDSGVGTSVLELYCVLNKKNEVGTVDIDTFRLKFMPLGLCLDERFLVELIYFFKSCVGTSNASTNSGLEDIDAVISWKNRDVARAAQYWLWKSQHAGESTFSCLGMVTPPAPLDLSRDSSRILKKSNLTKLKRLLVSDIAIKLSYQQHPDKGKSAVLYDLGGGYLSRMNIRVDQAKLNLELFEKSNFIGTSSSLFSSIQNHYQTEATKSMLQVLSAVNFRNTNFGITQTIRERLSFTSAKVESREFETKTYRSEDALLSDYKKRMRPEHGCRNIDALVQQLRNFVFDWRNNHRFVYARKICVVAVVNRSSRHLRIEKPKTNRLATSRILVPHTELPPGNSSLLEAWQSGSEWNNKGYTAWLVSSKYKEGVSLELSCVALRAKISVPGQMSFSATNDFNIAFLHKDVQDSHALYIMAVEDKIGNTSTSMMNL